MLDCENYNTTLQALSNIFQLETFAIEEFLTQNNLETIYSESTNRILEPPNDLLFKNLQVKHRVSTSYKYTCWFHSTRIPEEVTFEEGLKPLNMVIDDIKKYVDRIAENISVDEIPLKHGNGFHFSRKLNDNTDWGPYAFLVREIAFGSDDLNYDFLYLPEIVSDYIDCYYLDKRIGIVEAYRRNTTSCIVKFRTDLNDLEFLKRALRYLHDKFHRQEFSIDSNTCFDGRGEIIKKESILKIELLE